MDKFKGINGYDCLQSKGMYSIMRQLIKFDSKSEELRQAQRHETIHKTTSTLFLFTK